MKYGPNAAATKWLMIAGSVLLLVGCGPAEPEATAPVWKNVDIANDNQGDFFPQAIDSTGNTWQALTNDSAGHSLRMVDNTGVELWRLSMTQTIVQLVPFSAGMIVLTDNNNLIAVNIDGDVLWQNQSLPIDGERTRVKVSSNDHVQVTTLVNFQYINATLLDTDGSVLWSQELEFEPNLRGSDMVELGDGNIVLVYVVYDTTLGVVRRSVAISADGIVASPQALPAEINNLSITSVDANDAVVILRGYAGAAGLNSDGSVAWIYYPAQAPICSAPVSSGLTCITSVADSTTLSTVDRIANDGTVVSGTFPRTSGLNFVGQTETGEVFFKRIRRLGTSDPDSMLTWSVLFGFTYLDYFVDDIYRLDANNMLSLVAALPGRQIKLVQAPVMIPLSSAWESTQAPQNITGVISWVDTQMIVAGHVYQTDAVSGVRVHNNQVAAYSVE